jgi:predicted house-cleaning noncanonical NTP pyrophosphatase (MazG superfamily)
MAEQPARDDRKLFPARGVILVTKSGVTTLLADAVSLQNVGQKAFGLTTLPSPWTLPFVCVAADLYRDYKAETRDRAKILREWANRIQQAVGQVGIGPDDCILVRSSGRGEGLAARGKFYSESGHVRDVRDVLEKLLAKLAEDSALQAEEIPLLVQKCASPTKITGHLSNERRCYEEPRDWLGEMEAADTGHPQRFSINLRRWRNKLSLNLDKKLECELSTHIAEVLKAPANWAFEKQARVHFEWVWDGKTVYLVQADEEIGSGGHNPEEEHSNRAYQAVTFTPKILKRVTTEHAGRFAKLDNALTYLKLGLPCAPLYLLDDESTIRGLSEGKVPQDLVRDITELVKGSLVIRLDVATEDLPEKQLLPRTDEKRDAQAAIEWMTKESKALLQFRHDCAFIFHNFIPAQSAAFAYADPTLPTVQIEALWGLPEGLYYNSHDQFVVDTLKPSVAAIAATDVARFPVRERKNFKQFFVSTTPTGKWETLKLAPPYDWKPSISHDVARQIAYDSRRIAAVVGHPISIMWFIGVPKEISEAVAIPWYHEAYNLEGNRPHLTHRTKTPFDKSFIIETSRDVEHLKREEFVTRQNRIRIQPSEPELLRDRDTLRNIGEIAKSKGAIIVLEGAILCHAYYQLLETGARVEVVHPFIGFQERQEFDKLVRDKIPDIIAERGERVMTERLNGEAFERALRQKLVEEAYEVLDAPDLESVVAELADVKDVVDALIEHLKTAESDTDVGEQRTEKQKRLGGFAKRIVLIETHNVPPTAAPPQDQAQLQGLTSEAIPKTIGDAEFNHRSNWIEKRPDRRTAPGKTELRVNVTVPVTKSDWSASTTTEPIPGDPPKVISGEVIGSRHGPQWNFQFSVSIEDNQPELFPTKVAAEQPNLEKNT